MLLHLAEAEDAGLIADTLEGSSDDEVREMALLAAGTALAQGEEPDRRLSALIAAMALDEELEIRDRRNALRALADLDLPEVEELIVRLTESSEPELQAYAAFCLKSPPQIRRHRALLERLAASWPVGAGWEAQAVREALEGFHSTYWKDAALDDPVLRRAHEELRFPLDDAECMRAFNTLLYSEDPVAVGIAFDHYESWEGLGRVLGDHEIAEDCLPEVLARAREVLRRPMAPAEVSALNVIGAQHAEPEDADLLVAVLACSDSDAVRNEAIWMASGVFGKAETKDARLVAALGDLILGPGFSLTKDTAIRVLAEGLGADADDLLLRALREGDPQTQAHAACFLVKTGGLERHRPALVAVAESWKGRAPCHPWGRDPIELILGRP
jgi:HEAT repeat protein